jgi:hypothetical protein
MPPKDFKPPRHVERCSCIFDRRTGEIVATETRWTDEGAESTGVSRDLLHTIAADSGRTPGDLDVIEVKPRAGQTPVRVDVKTRKLVAGRVGKPKDVQVPSPIRRP